MWLDAVRLTDNAFDTVLGQRLRRLPAKADTESAGFGGDASADAPTLTVVIDQLDESPMLPRLAAELEASLAGRDTTGLRVLVACRTADYPSAMTRVLEGTVGRCLLADLAPLRRVDAETLASSVGLAGHELVRAATEVAAGGLASVPLTLGLLVRIYQERGSLPSTATEVFALSARLLVDEPDTDRRQVVTRWRRGTRRGRWPDRRATVACRSADSLGGR